jgi:branched-chain amino acid transport system substrate-binding protein
MSVEDTPGNGTGGSNASGGQNGGGAPGSAGANNGSGGLGTAGEGSGGIPGYVGECETNLDCVKKLTGASKDEVPAVCVRPQQRCAALKSEDCTTITGDYKDDSAIVIGSLFQTSGTAAATNLARQQSATLAVELINSTGGIPGKTSADANKLVMVSCNATENLEAAAQHLVDAGVPAIVGPNSSQDTLDVSTKVTIKAGVVVITPSALAASIAALVDDGFTWLLVPTEVQRAPLMINQIQAFETAIKQAEEDRPVRLAIAYRDDAVGIGTKTSLSSVVLNGKPLSDGLGKTVSVDGFNPAAPNQDALVAKYATFKPDIVVLAGLAEVITKVMVPLEAALPQDITRPQYLIIDPAKAPELLAAVKGNADLRHRVRGVGVSPSATSLPVYEAFKQAYIDRYKVGDTTPSATISGMGPAFDATYAIAFALAATRGEPVSGKAVASGFRKLWGGATKVTTTAPSEVRTAFKKLVGGESVSVTGTFSPLRWDEDGAIEGSTLEVWCIKEDGDKTSFASSGLTFDTGNGKTSGAFTQCPP